MIKYGVFTTGGLLISHKIHSSPKDIYFPALFDDLNDAKDYAKGIGVVKKVNIKCNKKVLS